MNLQSRLSVLWNWKCIDTRFYSPLSTSASNCRYSSLPKLQGLWEFAHQYLCYAFSSTMLINIKASHILVSVDHTEEVRFQKIVMKGLRNIGCKDEVGHSFFSYNSSWVRTLKCRQFIYVYKFVTAAFERLSL